MKRNKVLILFARAVLLIVSIAAIMGIATGCSSSPKRVDDTKVSSKDGLGIPESVSMSSDQSSYTDSYPVYATVLGKTRFSVGYQVDYYVYSVITGPTVKPQDSGKVHFDYDPTKPLTSEMIVRRSCGDLLFSTVESGDRIIVQAAMDEAGNIYCFNRHPEIADSTFDRLQAIVNDSLRK